jgi:hypothetical protein
MLHIPFSVSIRAIRVIRGQSPHSPLCAFVPLCEKLSSPISVSLVPISGFSCSPVTMTTTATLTTTTTGWLVKTKRNRGFALQGCCASVSCAAKPLWSATPPRLWRAGGLRSRATSYSGRTGARPSSSGLRRCRHASFHIERSAENERGCEKQRAEKNRQPESQNDL